MNTTAAVYYEEDAYGTAGKRLLGRQAAGEGFLRRRNWRIVTASFL